MTPLGAVIEARRVRLGMSRPVLAQRLGVSVQTVLNIERDPNYNLGTKLLRLIEEALGIEFIVTTVEATQMSNDIRIGTDECILYVRKNHPSNTTPNNQLGRLIAEWLRAQPTVDETAIAQSTDVACLWGAGFVGPGNTGLPATAAQHRLPLALLPELFTYLDNVGREAGASREPQALRAAAPSSAAVFDPESVIGLFDSDAQVTLNWIRARVEQEWASGASRWGQPEPKEAWFTVKGVIQVRFLPYTGPTGHHVAIWTGADLRAYGTELVQRLLGVSSEQIERWGPNTHSINIPVAELASLERRFAFMSAVAALAARA